MTTGPLPRIRTELGFWWASIIGRSPGSPRGGDKPVEHSERIERARSALGVVLDGLDRQLRMAQPFDRPVVEVDLADPEPGCGRERLADDLDLVVLRRDLDQ